MFTLSANISLLYPELPFLERVGAAARAGFRAVEVMYPYDHDPSRFANALLSNGLTLSVLNAPPGNHAAGERGLAAIPGKEQAFRNSLNEAIDFATITRCSNIHVLTGVIPEGACYQKVRETLRVNLIHAAKLFAEHGMNLLLEPLSAQVVPNYSLTRLEAASEWVNELHTEGCTNVHLQVDLYHTQQEQGNLAALLQKYFAQISYIQIAGVPGRHEPTVGEINYRYLIDLLVSLGYCGWIGCEYLPEGNTDSGLAWARNWGLLEMPADLP